MYSTNIIGIITDNFGKRSVSYLVKLFDGKTRLMIISLVPKAVANTWISELLGHNTGKGKTKYATKLGSLTYTTRKQIDVVYPVSAINVRQSCYLSVSNSISNISKAICWVPSAGFSEFDVSW